MREQWVLMQPVLMFFTDGLCGSLLFIPVFPFPAVGQSGSLISPTFPWAHFSLVFAFLKNYPRQSLLAYPPLS
jgi:uncharacterized RDD family membrane protein YckC